MHFCTAIIALQNDDQQQVQRGHYAPISWPEIDVIQALHGEGAVRQVIPFVQVDQTARDERQRLELIYGEQVVSRGGPDLAPVYPGRNPNMVLEAPEFTLVPGTRWVNPLSGLTEVLQEDGSSVPVPLGPRTIDEFNTVTPGPRVVQQVAQVVGDPRPGNPDTGETSPRGSSGRYQRRSTTAPYSDEAGFEAP